MLFLFDECRIDKINDCARDASWVIIYWVADGQKALNLLHCEDQRIDAACFRNDESNGIFCGAECINGCSVGHVD